jgi:hypothetical protein
VWKEKGRDKEEIGIIEGRREGDGGCYSILGGIVGLRINGDF